MLYSVRCPMSDRHLLPKEDLSSPVSVLEQYRDGKRVMADPRRFVSEALCRVSLILRHGFEENVALLKDSPIGTSETEPPQPGKDVARPRGHPHPGSNSQVSVHVPGIPDEADEAELLPARTALVVVVPDSAHPPDQTDLPVRLFRMFVGSSPDPPPAVSDVVIPDIDNPRGLIDLYLGEKVGRPPILPDASELNLVNPKYKFRLLP